MPSRAFGFPRWCHGSFELSGLEPKVDLTINAGLRNIDTAVHVDGLDEAEIEPMEIGHAGRHIAEREKRQKPLGHNLEPCVACSFSHRAHDQAI